MDNDWLYISNDIVEMYMRLLQYLSTCAINHLKIVGRKDCPCGLKFLYLCNVSCMIHLYKFEFIPIIYGMNYR